MKRLRQFAGYQTVKLEIFTAFPETHVRVKKHDGPHNAIIGKTENRILNEVMVLNSRAQNLLKAAAILPCERLDFSPCLRNAFIVDDDNLGVRKANP